MVEVVQGRVRTVPYPVGGSRTGPVVEIHCIKRWVHGNEISIEVEGEMNIAACEYVFARELKLNTLQVLLLTCEQPWNTGRGYIAQKHIFLKGQYDNYASIEVYTDAGTLLTAGNGPDSDGSIWLNFKADGE
jgi:hypothetical protein